jgi:hypothetical protein
MKKVPVIHKMPACKWQVQMLRLMSNPKQTLKEKSGDERVLLWPERLRPRRRRPRVTSSKGSLEDAPNLLRRRQLLQIVGAAQHDDTSVTISTARRIGSLAYDR